MAQNNAKNINSAVFAGDVTGPLNYSKVVKLQGNAVDSTAPSDNYVLQWINSASQWQPKSLASLDTVKVVTTTLASDYTIQSGDVAIVVTAANSSAYGGGILFPASAVTGRTVIIANARTNSNTNRFKIIAHAGTSVSSSYFSPNFYDLAMGGIWTCIDGTNWISLSKVV